MKMNFSPHKRALEELMSHLDKSDDKDLGSAMKPDGAGLEVTKVEATGDPDTLTDAVETDGTPKLSEEEIAELIEALQSKLT